MTEREKRGRRIIHIGVHAYVYIHTCVCAQIMWSFVQNFTSKIVLKNL